MSYLYIENGQVRKSEESPDISNSDLLSGMENGRIVVLRVDPNNRTLVDQIGYQSSAHQFTATPLIGR